MASPFTGDRSSDGFATLLGDIAVILRIAIIALLATGQGSRDGCYKGVNMCYMVSERIPCSVITDALPVEKANNPGGCGSVSFGGSEDTEAFEAARTRRVLSHGVQE